MRPPVPRGPLSDRLLRLLLGPFGPASDVVLLAERSIRDTIVGCDEDIQLSLLVLQELDYDGLDGADERWEQSADLFATRRMLEDAYEAELRADVQDLVEGAVAIGRRHDVATAIFALTDEVAGPPLAKYVHRKASRAQLEEFLMHRSVYHLKEADPHTRLVPQLRGAPKAALLEIQIDEYGSGRLDRMHSQLFADALRLAGLDATYGAHVDRVPATTLAESTAMSMFSGQRRLRGATAGHLAALEATSSLPNRRYAEGVRRLGLGEDAARFFDEHIEADAVHEQVATRDLCGGLVAADPTLLDDILLGAAVSLTVGAHSAQPMLDAWQRNESSLLSLPAEHAQAAG